MLGTYFLMIMILLLGITNTSIALISCYLHRSHSHLRYRRLQGGSAGQAGGAALQVPQHVPGQPQTDGRRHQEEGGLQGRLERDPGRCK